MGNKRERLEVIYDILKIIRNSDNLIRPTPLLRYSNLSSQRFSGYIDELIEKKFIRQIEDKKGKKCFTLSDLGFKYLEKYKVILNFINELNL